MILKQKQQRQLNSTRAIAGEKQEKDVAFYLRRAFKDNERVLVINDYHFSHNNENAQIDHLVIYPYGFVLIESKSISGHVRVNKEGEWSRTVNKHWQGIKSPIKQVELQTRLLKEYLHHNRTSILRKFLGVQQTFNGRQWHQICAVSSNAMLDRNNMPKEISTKIVKSEFVSDKLNQIMNLKLNLLNRVTDHRPCFSADELSAVASFLLAQNENNLVEEMAENTVLHAKHFAPKTNFHDYKIYCKHCAEKSALTGNYGRYGYFISCGACGKTTSMKSSCPSCSSKTTRVSKQSQVYRLHCDDCSSQHVIFDEVSCTTRED